MASEKLKQLALKYWYVLLLLVVLPYAIAKAYVGGDFVVYLAASQKLLHGEDCYNILLNYQGGTWYSMYGYSPLFALLLMPVTFLPAIIPQLFFLLADVWFIYRVIKLLRQWLDVDSLPNTKWWYILVIAFSLRFILHNFEMVQLNILLLWLTTEALYRIFFKQQILVGALLLALGINFKILPIVFLPYLLWRAQYKAFAVVLIYSALLLLLPSLWLGFNFNVQLHKEWFAIVNPMNAQFNAEQNTSGPGIHGIAALVASCFSLNSNGQPQMFITALTVKTQLIIVNVLRLLLAGLTILFLRSRPFVAVSDTKQFATETSYLFLVTPLLFPQQNKWAYVYILPALAVIFYAMLSNKKNYISISVMAVVFILTTVTSNGIIGNKLHKYTECYKLITFGTLLLIPQLYINRINSTKTKRG